MKWNLATSDSAGIADRDAAASGPAQLNASQLCAALGISAPAARVLWSRGYRDLEAARRFFAPALGDLVDPFLLTGMDVAVARLRRAIEQHEPILLYGDYDVDGTTAVVILKKAIELLGGLASFHVPHRLRDGYGMRSDVVEEAAAAGVKLIVSVDTGIRAGEVVKHASELGIDVIVTDHHLPEAKLPPAIAVLNPNQPGDRYPEKNLCGAGVAFKLADALVTASGWKPSRRNRLLESLLKMVAIATVADVVPLTGENRVIVKLGLEGLRQVRNVGLRALLDVSGFVEGDCPSATQVAFRIAPRINAAGRMASASDVIELFLTSDESRARELAEQLHDLNQDRQQTEADIARAIFEQCAEETVTDQDAALVFAREGWHRGVVGIVASRVVEKFHRPVFVLSIENGVAQGSGRSISAFHLLDALEAMPELFTKFGGHRQAAGITLDSARVDEFRARFRAHAGARLTPADFEPSLAIDAEIDFAEITDEAVADVLRLAPFGFGNPSPVFAMRGVEVAAPPDVKNEKHVFVRFKSPEQNPKRPARPLRAKAWNFADRAGELQPGSRIDIALVFEDDAYSAGRGYAPWQAILRDVKTMEPASNYGSAQFTRICRKCQAEFVPAPDQPEHINICPECGSSSWSAPAFPDLQEKNLPERRIDTRICRKCQREFVATPNHAGFIDICPTCDPRS